MANFLGRLQTFLFGAAIGRAASDSVTPVLEPVRQKAWFKNQNKVLDPVTAAALLAKRFITRTEAEFDASRSGIASNRLNALTKLAQSYPGLSELDRMSNRKILTPDAVKEVLARHGIPDTYTEAYLALFADILTPGELAAAIHRGLVPSEGLLLGEQPEPPFKVEAYPVQDIPPIQEAAGSGYDKERLQVLVGLQGLPMGPHEAAQAYFRGIITHGDYIRAFNTSNMRNEWAQAILDQTRQIPTARDFMENALRGYSNLADALEGAKRHGMSVEDATLIYQNQGRPMNIRQITQALARGAKFKPEPGEIKDPYLAATVEGPIKPAYYELFQSLKYALPSPFVMRALAESGVWSEAKTAERLKWAGWFPQDADEAAAAWAGGTSGAAVDPREKLATTQAIASLKRRFMAELIDSGGALAGLEQLGIAAGSAGRILETWTTERGWTEKLLTPANIKKAYSENTFTQAEAIDALVTQHRYSPGDAQTFLTL